MRTAQATKQSYSFEQFMASMEKYQKETARLHTKIAQYQAETDRQLKENAKQMKETGKKISDLGNRFGEVVEYLVMPNLVEKFSEMGFEFTKAYPEATIKDKQNQILAEIDITLENGDKVMIVEVKTKPGIRDIKDHIKRMETVRRHADLHGDKRKFLGAVAGMVVKDNVREFAFKSGFYLLEPSGDTFTITKPTRPYRPHQW